MWVMGENWRETEVTRVQVGWTGLLPKDLTWDSSGNISRIGSSGDVRCQSKVLHSLVTLKDVNNVSNSLSKLIVSKIFPRRFYRECWMVPTVFCEVQTPSLDNLVKHKTLPLFILLQVKCSVSSYLHLHTPLFLIRDKDRNRTDRGKKIWEVS